MITCLCPADDRAPDLDAAIELPWIADPVALCLESGPHFHRCFRPAEHGGRHVEVEVLDARVRVAVAVWDD